LAKRKAGIADPKDRVGRWQQVLYQKWGGRPYAQRIEQPFELGNGLLDLPCVTRRQTIIKGGTQMLAEHRQDHRIGREAIQTAAGIEDLLPELVERRLIEFRGNAFEKAGDDQGVIEELCRIRG